MTQSELDAGGALLGRFLRVANALATATDADTAARTLAYRIGEVFSCERAVFVRLDPLQPQYANDGQQPAQYSALADAIRLAAARVASERGPSRLGGQGGQRRAGFDRFGPRTLGEGPQDALQRVLCAHGGTSVMWWPLPARGEESPRYALWLERHRGRDWKDEELSFAYRVGPLLAALIPAAQMRAMGRRLGVGAVVVLMCVLAAFIPVPATVTAPVQVVAANPAYVFADIDGIVGTLAVEPGQQVQAGDLLVMMDTRVLEKNVEEARQGVAAGEAELARVRAASHYEAEARARLKLAEIELERARLALEFHSAQLSRAAIRSPRSGVVLLEDPDRLQGLVVRAGERLMSVADPADTRLKIMVPLADYSLVDQAAPVRVALDRSPLAHLPAQVTRKAYSVQLSDEQLPSIEVEARWSEDIPPAPPGARGVARISGERVLLVQHLLRKPLQALRRVWGV